MSAHALPVTAAVDASLLLLKRVAWRYLPLLFLCYVVSIIDRVNVGFAKLQMQQALEFSDVVYGLGAGIFFLGYFLFEVPSNMLLARVGARKWIARILLMWGPVAAGLAFVETPLQFYVLRFLLGVFEAGFFPGIVLLMTYWFPAERRTRYIAMLMLGMPVAGIVIGPLSAAIFGLWGPQLLQDILSTDVKGIGATFGVYFLLGTGAMLAAGRLADHAGRREAILVALLATGALGFFAAAAFVGQASIATIAMGVGVIAYLASFPVFWGSVTPRLAPAAAAAAIALINSLANLGGAVGTAVMGPIKQELGLAAAIAAPGVCLALAAVFALRIKRRLSPR